MITEDYVSFETAKLLKEKGFDEITFTWYNGKGKFCVGKNNYDDYHINSFPDRDKNKCSSPTLQMAMKWLREVHNLFIEIQCYGCEADEKAHFEYSYVISEYVKINNGICTVFGLEKRKAKSRFTSYEEACEAAIKYCLENLI